MINSEVEDIEPMLFAGLLIGEIQTLNHPSGKAYRATYEESNLSQVFDNLNDAREWLAVCQFQTDCFIEFEGEL